MGLGTADPQPKEGIMPRFIELNMVTGRQVDDLENATESTTKVWINPEEIREFYARREGAEGTRISYKNSSGIAVHETPEQVANAISVLVH
jgi:hypothetical protein